MLTYFQLKTKHQSLFLLFTIKKDPILYPLLRFVSIISLFCLKYFYEAHAHKLLLSRVPQCDAVSSSRQMTKASLMSNVWRTSPFLVILRISVIASSSMLIRSPFAAAPNLCKHLWISTVFLHQCSTAIGWWSRRLAFLTCHTTCHLWCCRLFHFQNASNGLFLSYNVSGLTLPAPSYKFHVLSEWARIWIEQVINSHWVGVIVSIAAEALLTLRIFPNKWSIDIKAETLIICGFHSFCLSHWFLKWHDPVYCSKWPSMLFGQAINVIQLIRWVSLGM